MIKVCSWCLDKKPGWYKRFFNSVIRKLFPVTDGICLDCYQKLTEETEPDENLSPCCGMPTDGRFNDTVCSECQEHF